MLFIIHIDLKFECTDSILVRTGHETASEHVHTFLEEILPALIDTSTRIYFIVLGKSIPSRHLFP